VAGASGGLLADTVGYPCHFAISAALAAAGIVPILLTPPPEARA
jgi:hypothetical protein